MLNNNVPQQLAKALVGESASAERYFALGTGTTAESRGDTSLDTETGRTELATGTNESGVIQIRGTAAGGDASLHGNLTEVGLVDDASAGNLLERSTFSSLTLDYDKNIKITKFVGVSPKNTDKKIITTYGRNTIASWIGGTTFTVPDYIALGSRLILDKCDALGSNPNEWQNSTDASAASLNTTTLFEGTGSINLGKSGTASAIFYYERTLASVVDATGMTDLQIDINPLEPTDYDKLKSTDCLKIWIGNDSSNYYEITYDRADLIVGWQRLEIAISDMTETGSVDLANLDYMRITWETTNSSDTITSGNILMDYWALKRDLAITETALFDEQIRQATSAKASKNTRSSYKTVVLKADGNTYIYNYSGLLDSNSGGNLWFEEEYVDTFKDDKTQITQEISISNSIRSD